MAKAGLLFVGTDDGIVLFSNPGAVGRWLKVGQELRGQTVTHVWAAPDNPLIVLAGSGQALFRSDSGGERWQQVLATGVLAVTGGDADEPLYMVSAADGQLLRSDDAGVTWERDAAAATLSERLVALIWSAAAHAVALLDAQGSVWLVADQQLEQLAAPVPFDRLVVSSDGRWYGRSSANLYRRDTASATWVATGSAPGGSLAALSGQEPTLLASTGRSIQRSIDDGGQWSDTASEQEWRGTITAIVPVSYHIDSAFATSDGGELALSSDRGRTWQMLKRDLPAVRAVVAARLV